MVVVQGLVESYLLFIHSEFIEFTFDRMEETPLFFF
jgi:hypothetical protein